MTPAAALLDRLLELDQPRRISVGLAVLATIKLPAAERMTRVTGVRFMGRCARARDGWIWTSRHMPHHMASELR